MHQKRRDITLYDHRSSYDGVNEKFLIMSAARCQFVSAVKRYHLEGAYML